MSEMVFVSFAPRMTMNETDCARSSLQRAPASALRPNTRVNGIRKRRQGQSHGVRVSLPGHEVRCCAWSIRPVSRCQSFGISKPLPQCLRRDASIWLVADAFSNQVEQFLGPWSIPAPRGTLSRGIPSPRSTGWNWNGPSQVEFRLR